MYRYKCDRCGILVNVDPGEPRICDECVARMKLQEKKVPRIVYAGGKREVSYAR